MGLGTFLWAPMSQAGSPISGIGHGGIDGGFGYTYFDPTKGHEFSFVTGLTYNFKNTDTDYRNGIDWHLDWGASQFLSKQVFVGAVGYFYNQLTNDSGAAPSFSAGFKSRVIGAGPQIGYIFPVGGMQGFLGAKAYFEFDAKNRPDGWNGWLTFSLSPAALPHAAPVMPDQRRPDGLQMGPNSCGTTSRTLFDQRSARGRWRCFFTSVWDAKNSWLERGIFQPDMELSVLPRPKTVSSFEK